MHVFQRLFTDFGVGMEFRLLERSATNELEGFPFEIKHDYFSCALFRLRASQSFFACIVYRARLDFGDLPIYTLRPISEILIYVASFIHAFIRTLKPGWVKALAAENAALRHQLAIITRGYKRAPNLALRDRILLGLVVALIPSRRLRNVAAVLKPNTLLRFHQNLVKRKYKSLYSSKPKLKPGPKGLSQEVVNAIVQMKQLNPSFGPRKIAPMINHYFGLGISYQQVYRVLGKHGLTGPDEGPSWLSFLGSLKDSLWSIDFFRCESATLRSHWVMVMMDQFSRRIIGFAVRDACPSGPDMCRMLAQIIKSHDPPKLLSSDHDPVFVYYQWQANLPIRPPGMVEVRKMQERFSALIFMK